MLTLLTLDAFDELYQLMETSFPPTERRTKADQRALFSNPAYRVYGVWGEHGTLSAFLAVWDLRDVLFLEHFAVSPTMRGQGLGSKLLAELTHNTQKTVCLEVEPPSTDIATRRIAFYQRNGFSLNTYPYEQPSLAPGQPSIPLMIMTYGGTISPNAFRQMQAKLYREVYCVEPTSK